MVQRQAKKDIAVREFDPELENRLNGYMHEYEPRGIDRDVILSVAPMLESTDPRVNARAHSFLLSHGRGDAGDPATAAQTAHDVAEGRALTSGARLRALPTAVLKQFSPSTADVERAHAKATEHHQTKPFGRDEPLPGSKKTKLAVRDTSPRRADLSNDWASQFDGLPEHLRPFAADLSAAVEEDAASKWATSRDPYSW
jgi:hypothetical protein